MCKLCFNQLFQRKYVKGIELDFCQLYIHTITSKCNNYTLGNNSKSKENK